MGYHSHLALTVVSSYQLSGMGKFDREGGALQEFGKPEPKTVLLQAQSASRRRTNSFQLCADSAAPPRLRQHACAALCSRRRSNTFPRAARPPPHLAAAARSLPRAPSPAARFKAAADTACSCRRPQHAAQMRSAEVQVEGGAGPQLVHGIRACGKDSTR